MALSALFHQREEKKELEKKEVSYTDIPSEARGRIVYLLDRYIGDYKVENNYLYGLSYEEPPTSNTTWEWIERNYLETTGKFDLGNGSDSKQKVRNFIMMAQVSHCLSMIELAMLGGLAGFYKFHSGDYDRRKSSITINPLEAEETLNDIFKYYRMGYQLLDGKIVKVGSDYLYKEAVERVSNELTELHFDGVKEEFSKALNYHRDGKPEEALAWANKAYESTMKAICDEMKIGYKSKETVKTLVPLMIQYILPPEFNPQLGGTKTLLFSLSGARNQMSGHGAGKKKRKVPKFVTSFAIHQAATTILLLVEAYKEKIK